MSRNYAILEKSDSEAVVPVGCYSELIRRLFRTPAVVAIVSRGAAHICEDIAAELAAGGKRVVIVPVGKQVCINPVHQPPSRDRISFFKPPAHSDPVKWLESLRLNFDAILLELPWGRLKPAVDFSLPAAGFPSFAGRRADPFVQSEQDCGMAEIAAMADSAVLAVEAGVTTKLQVRQDCRLLQSKGVKLAGAILTRRR